MKTPYGIELKIGQIWRECDNRFTRYVTIAGYDEVIHKVRLLCDGRYSWADLRRFNGKTGGYIPKIDTGQ